MTTDPVVNFGKVTVSLPYDSIALSVILQSGHGSKLPDPSASGAFNLVWWNFTDYPDPSDDPSVEIVRCTARSIDTLTISRAQEGTLASNKNTASKTYKMILSPTKKLINDLDVVSGSLTVGGILFANSSGKIVHDYLNLFWDNTNKNVSIGTTVPFAGLSSRHGLDITGSQTYQSIQLKNSGTGGNGWELTSANNTDVNIGGKLAFVANNVIQSVMTSDGKLGIGTNSPVQPLHISRTTNELALRIQNTGLGGRSWGLGSITANFAASGNPTGLFTIFDESTGGSPGMRFNIDSSGNVGIGTSSPGDKLTISGGDLNLSASGTYGNINNARNIILYNTTGLYTSGGLTGTDFPGQLAILGLGSGIDRNVITFYTRDTSNINQERMRIDINGNVGIGTIIPSSLLDIKGQTSIGTRTDPAISIGGLNIRQAAAAEFLGWTDGAVQGVLGGVGGVPYIGSKNNTAFGIYTNNTERVRIDNVGNVGIGTTSPTHQLHTSSNARFNNCIIQSTGGDNFQIFPYLNTPNPNFSIGIDSSTTNGTKITGDSGNLYFYVSSAGVPSSEKMRIDGGGRVGIGMASTGYQLQLSTDSAAKPGTNTWTISSDERIKKDIRPFTDGIQTVLNINPVWYKYNGKAGFKDDNTDHIGIIGQHIKDVAPYTINTYKAKLNENDKEETELLNFNSHALTFVLINAMKEIINKIEIIEKRLFNIEK